MTAPSKFVTIVIFVVALLLLLGAAAVSASFDAQDSQRSVWDGVYTTAQAARGAALFDKECAGCHGAAGNGGSMAPALAGPAFSSNYDGMTVGDLFDRNRTTMPPGNEGAIPAQQLVDITAFMLQVNGFPAGSTELPAQSMSMKAIQYVATQPDKPKQGDRPPGTHQDNTLGSDGSNASSGRRGSLVSRSRK